MIEAEEAFLEGDEGEKSLIKTAEDLVKYSLKNTIETLPSDVHFHWQQNENQQVWCSL